jgi:hypothetical protein
VPTRGAWGAGRFFNSSGLVKRAVSGPASGTFPEGYARGGLTRPTRTGPGEARRNKAVAFHNPQAFSNVQKENRGAASAAGSTEAGTDRQHSDYVAPPPLHGKK